MEGGNIGVGDKEDISGLMPLLPLVAVVYARILGSIIVILTHTSAISWHGDQCSSHDKGHQFLLVEQVKLIQGDATVKGGRNSR